MRAAGIEHAWGIEKEDDIAAVARMNGLNTITADILDCDPADFERVDFLHASPPCPNFSNAKANGYETALDIALARKVAEFVEVLRPRFFTLENVYKYRESKSWGIIALALLTQGYSFNFWHVNMANYGIIRRCPIHHVLELTRKNANGAEQYLSHASNLKTAPDIVQQSAKMPVDAQARILAWDAMVELAQQMTPDIAENVTLKELALKLQRIKPVQIIRDGGVDDILMNEVISVSGITADMFESIALLLKRCLVESCVGERLSTISTEKLQITARKILGCLITIPFTYPSTTRKQASPMDGDLEINGHSCPLCKIEGVPQTRKRMIVIARRDGLRPQLPPATHAERPEAGLFGTLKRWVGWYEAIEDLIPGLPESKFAKWQLERLPSELRTMLINGGGNTNFKEAYPGRGCLDPDMPSHTVTATSEEGGSLPRALIVDGRNSNQEWGKLYREDGEPATAVTALERPAHFPRAFVVEHQNTSRDATIRMENEPFVTVISEQMRRPSSTPSAFIMSNQQSETKDGMIPVTRAANEPATTIRTEGGGISNSFVNGRIVQMTTRALARFQAFPDWYVLPDNKRLACRGIGNAVPPSFSHRLYESLI